MQSKSLQRGFRGPVVNVAKNYGRYLLFTTIVFTPAGMKVAPTIVYFNSPMKVKKPTLKQLRDKLWKLVSLYVRTKETNCYTCLKYLELKQRSAGHFWTKKGHPYVRFDLMNVHTQCLTCNSFQSGNLANYVTRLIKDYGLPAYNELTLRAKSGQRFRRDELEAKINIFQLK